MNDASIVHEMLEAGEVALSECEEAKCTPRETVAAVYAAMQAMREIQEQRQAGALVH